MVFTNEGLGFSVTLNEKLNPTFMGHCVLGTVKGSLCLLFNSLSNSARYHFLDTKSYIHSKAWSLHSHPAVSDYKSPSF